MKKGFTLIELLAAIVVITIIFAIVMPSGLSLMLEAQKKADRETISRLNRITELYITKNSHLIDEQTVFDDYDNDDEIFQELIDSGLLSFKPVPQNSSDHFLWNRDLKKWVNDIYEIAEPPVENENHKIIYLFKDLSKSIFTFNNYGGGGGGSWSIDEIGLQTTGSNGNDLPFLGSPYEEYNLKVNFKLNNNFNESGGIGVFFQTVLETSNQNRETGHILQFDRNLSEIVLRTRVLGSESSSAGAAIIFRAGGTSSATIANPNIPHRSVLSFWESDKQFLIQVRNASQVNQKSITILVDDIVIVSNYIINSNINSINNHVGLRAWGTRPATFYSLEIEVIE